MRRIAICLLAALLLFASAAAEPSLCVYNECMSECMTLGLKAFRAENAGVEVRMTDEYEQRQRILDALTTRDDSIDVYIVSCSSDAFAAARDRGYLMELDGSETLKSLSERMAPGLREVLLSGDTLVAYPINGWLFAPRINEAMLREIGLSLADVPGDWMRFLQWLPELAEHFPEDEGYSLLGTQYSAEEARQTVFFELFNAYQQNLSREHTPRMTEMLEALEQIDFIALGQPETVASDALEWLDMEASESKTLLSFGVGTSLQGIALDESSMPFPMALYEGMPAALTLSSEVLIVNPHSKNRELALSFAESVVMYTDIVTQYALYTDMREPLENLDYETVLASARRNYDDVQEKIDSADESEKQALAERLRAAEIWLEVAESDKWILSEADIEWYAQYSDTVRFETNNWLYRDNTGAAAELVNRYLDGELPANRFMEQIDGKLQMMANEGY